MSQEDRIAQATAVQTRYEDMLLRLPNVVGVGVGLIYQGGSPTGEVGLVVMVERKLPAAQLASAERIPPELDGVRVDVQEVGAISAF